MLKQVGRYIGFVALWGLVIAVVVWANSLSSEHNATTEIRSTRITITGGGDHPLIDNRSIEEWLALHNLTPQGRSLDKTDIAALEATLKRHSAVEEANVYTTYDGCVNIDIRQREPIARLRVTGYDMYMTREGYLLPATDGYSVHVPVITGDYAPLFEPTYMGYARDMVRDTIAALEHDIATLEESKMPHYEALRDNNARLREVTSLGVKRGLFTSEAEAEVMAAVLKQKKSEARANHSAVERRINGEIAAIERAIGDIRHKQKEIRIIEEEFNNLIAFLGVVGESEFWSAEVVQIVATGGKGKPLQLAIIPRSGRFTVDLGTTERLGAKLDDLILFYRKGLDNVGWDRFRSISLRYDGQVVCK